MTYLHKYKYRFSLIKIHETFAYIHINEKCILYNLRLPSNTLQNTIHTHNTALFILKNSWLYFPTLIAQTFLSFHPLYSIIVQPKNTIQYSNTSLVRLISHGSKLFIQITRHSNRLAILLLSLVTRQNGSKILVSVYVDTDWF